MQTLEESVKQLGKDLGFDVVGITTAAPFYRDERAAVERVRAGLMDGLPWYTEERVHRATHPERLLPDAKSIISLAISYAQPIEVYEAKDDLPRGKVARYALGDDYHEVMKSRLKQFVESLAERVGREVRSRIFVDDGPMNDRAAAERAGVGWFGKNTNVMSPGYGSWLLLGQVITDLVLKPDTPLMKNCGSCVRCIDDCPTGAIIAPYVIDNTRCISYLTIELRGPIPIEMRPLLGTWVFGCDICQEVCPVNRKSELGTEPAFQARHDFAAPELIPLLELDDEAFRERFRKSPIKRAKRIGLQRNVCVALGNIGSPEAIPALSNALLEREPLVQAHAAWALGQIGGESAVSALESASGNEPDPTVAEEIQMALVGARSLAQTT